MFMRITRGAFDQAHEDETKRITEQAVVPGLKALPGFQSYQGGLDRNNQRLVAISCWDTEEQAKFMRDQKIADAVSQLQAIGVRLENPDIYEVTIQA